MICPYCEHESEGLDCKCGASFPRPAVNEFRLMKVAIEDEGRRAFDLERMALAVAA